MVFNNICFSVRNAFGHARALGLLGPKGCRGRMGLGTSSWRRRPKAHLPSWTGACGPPLKIKFIPNFFPPNFVLQVSPPNYNYPAWSRGGGEGGLPTQNVFPPKFEFASQNAIPPNSLPKLCGGGGRWWGPSPSTNISPQIVLTTNFFSPISTKQNNSSFKNYLSPRIDRCLECRWHRLTGREVHNLIMSQIV